MQTDRQRERQTDGHVVEQRMCVVPRCSTAGLRSGKYADIHTYIHTDRRTDRHVVEQRMCVVPRCGTAGLRSGKYAAGLQAEGFKVSNLRGSILAWVGAQPLGVYPWGSVLGGHLGMGGCAAVGGLFLGGQVLSI
jgi:hypothetical protein